MNRRIDSSGERGFVIVIALIAILAMTFFLITGISTTSSSVKIAGNYSKTVGVFNLAEVGLAKARPLLENRSFTDILTNYSATYLIQPTAFTGGTYEVKVADDAKDTDGNTLADSNGIIKVISTGRNPQGGKVEIETHVQLIGGTNPISEPPDPGDCGQTSCDSAALLCGADTDVSVVGGLSKIDGADYQTLPPVGCTGIECNITPTTDTGNYDIISSGNIDLLSGTPTLSEDLGVDAQCDEWQTFYTQWASAQPNGTSVILLNGDKYDGTLDGNNSCDTPKVYIINTTATTYKFTGNTYLCGTFIVASETNIDLSGTVTLAGIVMVMGDTSDIAYSGTGGTAQLVGKLIFKSETTDKQKELVVQGGAQVLFSSTGVAAGMAAINNANTGGGADGAGRLITAAWEENY